jgi:uncharacterized membrane protein YbhN (UPF0104 family)
MYSVFLNWAKGLVTLIIFTASLYLFYRYRDEFYLISKITPALFIGLSFLTILSIIINGNKLRHITKSFNIQLNFNEWVGLAFISSFFNGIVYKSGSLFTSNYLKRNHDFSYASFIGALGADHLMMILINACVGLVASIYITILSANIFPILFFFLAIIIGVFYLFRNPFGLFKPKNQFFDTILRASETLNKILQNKLLFKELLLNNCFLIMVIGLRLYFACQAMGINFELFYCYIFTSVSAFIRLIPMLQSDIGSRELTVGFLSESFGSGFRQGVLATVVDRIFEIIWALIGIAIFKNLLFKTIHNKSKNNI